MTPPSRLQRLEDLVKELSFENDPDRLVRAFGQQRDLFHDSDGLITVNCRDLKPPAYRISRSWRWRQRINPYTEAHLLPQFEDGILGELLYTGKPCRIDHLFVANHDPTREHFEGMHSLACAHNYHQGEVQGMAVLLHRQPASFTDEDLETLLLNTNLIGRAANVLALTQELERAYGRLDYEMHQVGKMQRHLLPGELPRIEGLSLSASYTTCSSAGGDYYDVLSLPDGQWGLFLADVSGHGVPAAVLVAILHTLLHTYPGTPMSPSRVMEGLNAHLLTVAPDGMFATAFYGVYEVGSRRLTYSLAGHPPPCLRRGSGVQEIDSDAGLPLGLFPQTSWIVKEIHLRPGDALLLFTDGFLDGTNAAGEPFGRLRLEEALKLAPLLGGPLVQHVERHFRDFCAGAPELDDRTLLAAVGVP